MRRFDSSFVWLLFWWRERGLGSRPALGREPARVTTARPEQSVGENRATQLIGGQGSYGGSVTDIYR
jgi:hypothetical protein